MRTYVATMTLAALFLSASSEAAPVCGDVNKSNTVTSSDALTVLKAAVGQMVPLNCPAFAEPLQTGQTTCWNPADTTAPISTIACGGTGEDGAMQNGLVRSFKDNGDGTVTDNGSGLTWEKLSDDGGIHDKDNTYTWAAALGKAAALSSANFAGHNDWRLPNRFELESILNLAALTPSTYAEFNTACAPGCTVLTCSCTTSDYYWTSSTFQSDPTGAWAFDFYDSFLNAYFKTEVLWARAVRGKS